ncbi:hypothetical protein CRUP_017236 [Coryphaenoides rupestris]|nr:hypothetical protein CRUP_017236 [Coryphaenoides rupestris]
MTAYRKEGIPERLHYRDNPRVQPIILLADEGWMIIRRGTSCPRVMGNHGYDNALPSMHPFLAASGPGFQRGYRTTGLRSVDVYPLMCHLLGVAPAPNNGSLAQARCVLAGESCLDVAMPRRTQGPVPFQRLQLEEDDDDEPLLD